RDWSSDVCSSDLQYRNREYDLLGFGYGAQLRHLDLTLLLTGQRFQNWRLNQRYQCHIGIGGNRNGSQQFRRQSGGDKDGGRTVSTTDNTDGSGLLNGEIHQPNITEESRAKQGTEDTELRSCTQQQGFRVRQQRAKIGHGTHTHKDQQRRNTTGNGDLIEGVQNAILETG